MQQRALDLENLLQNPAIHRADRSAVNKHSGISTGFRELDHTLPEGGWQASGLTEILTDQQGVGELSLLMPALARLSEEKRWITWIAPPHIPYGPALMAHGVDLSRVLLVHTSPGADTLWALEQALSAGTCGAVLGWLDNQAMDHKILRRLKLAAKAGQSAGFLFRTLRCVENPSPADLRLVLENMDNGLEVHVLKCRGRSGVSLMLDVEHALAEPVFPNANTGYRRARHYRH